MFIKCKNEVAKDALDQTSPGTAIWIHDEEPWRNARNSSCVIKMSNVLPCMSQ